MLDEQLLDDLDKTLSDFIAEPALGGDVKLRNSLLQQLITESRKKENCQLLITEEADFLDTCASFIRAAVGCNPDGDTLSSVADLFQFFCNLYYHCEEVSKLDYLGLKDVCSKLLDKDIENNRLERLSVELAIKVNRNNLLGVLLSNVFRLNAHPVIILICGRFFEKANFYWKVFFAYG